MALAVTVAGRTCEDPWYPGRLFAKLQLKVKWGEKQTDRKTGRQADRPLCSVDEWHRALSVTPPVASQSAATLTRTLLPVP